MAAYIAKRLLAAIPVLLGLTIIVFLMIALIPGGTAVAILGPLASPEAVAKLNAELGLDQPLLVQYLHWLGNLVLHGDLGRSYSLKRPVVDEVVERFSATLILAGTSLVLCSILGLLAGVVSAVRQFGWTDKIVTFFVLIGISTPSFFLGLILILVFAVDLRMLPGKRHVRLLWRRRPARPAPPSHSCRRSRLPRWRPASSPG